MIQEILDELQETWDMTPYEIDHIRQKILEYALACQMDSDILEECETELARTPENIVFVDFSKYN